MRKAFLGASLAVLMISLAGPAMAADWRYQTSSNDRHYLEAECHSGTAFGAWNECDIRSRNDGGYDLFVR
ncbi:hypothetical protein [Amycolatopsis jejuensis]|uniref:hypothetical protein n=1 Tax=Amycolatopsis jejuensis TaxID=330084 RepID=UPI0005242EC5|nr:hypothetical protein [Amycolatopsis jejuensis]